MLSNCGAGENCWRVSWTARRLNQVNPTGNQPWIFIGGTDGEAQALIFWPPDGKSQLIGKDPDSGKDWRQKEERGAENEIDSITNSIDMNLLNLWEIVKNEESWSAVHGVTKSWTRLCDWTTHTHTHTHTHTSSCANHLLMDSSYFYVLAIVNNDPMNIGMHVSFLIIFSSIYSQEWDYWMIWQLYL